MFVHNYSDFKYVHLMSKIDAEAMVEANLALKRTFCSYGVKDLHYHAYNGLFGPKEFKEAYNIEK